MMSPRDLSEMKALVQRVVAGSVSREDWSDLAALTLIWHGDETIVAIAAQGLDAFIKVSKPIYDDHGFRHEDYRRMYDRVCAAAAEYPTNAVRH